MRSVSVASKKEKKSYNPWALGVRARCASPGGAVSRSLSSIVRRDVSGLCREFDCLAVPLRAPAQEVLVETSQGKSCRVDLASRALLVLLFRTRCLTRYRLQQHVGGQS